MTKKELPNLNHLNEIRNKTYPCMSYKDGKPDRSYTAKLHFPEHGWQDKYHPIDVIGGIIFHDDKIFCLTITTGQRALDIPGGHVNPGESPEEALEREMREEVGVDITATPIPVAIIESDLKGPPSYLVIYQAKGITNPTYPTPGNYQVELRDPDEFLENYGQNQEMMRDIFGLMELQTTPSPQ